jgi:tetratricopeptide (TPR) repeat protein
VHEASALAGLGRHEQGLTLTDRALEVLIKAFGAKHPHVANAYVTRGALHAELKHRAKAIADLEQARALFADLVMDPGHLAGAEWGLGKLVFDADPQRGRALVAQAIARFAKASPTWKPSAADAAAWLASH